MIEISAIQKQALGIAGDDLSSSQWRIGDIAIDIVDTNVGKHPLYTILHEISQICGLGWRRVGKIMSVCSEFPSDTRLTEWSFGYYERAMDFDTPHEAIEFLVWYAEQYQRVPTIGDFALIYSQHILGHLVEDAVIRSDKNPMPPEPDVFMEYIGQLRAWVHRRLASTTNAEEVIRLLDRIEALLMEESQVRIHVHTESPI